MIRTRSWSTGLAALATVRIMSDFLNKAKDALEQVEDKIPDPIKDKVEDAKEKLVDKLPDSVGDKVSSFVDLDDDGK